MQTAFFRYQRRLQDQHIIQSVLSIFLPGDWKLRAAVLWMIASCFQTPLAQAADGQGKPIIIILKMIGRGSVKRGNTRVEAQPKLILQVGDTVTTEKNSSMVIQFADGSSHTLLQNSIITLEDIVSYSSNEGFSFSAALKMARGKARFFFKPREARRHSSVRTHNATLGVRGTRFLVDNQDLQNTHVVVFSGEVAAANNQNPNQSVSVKPGQYSRIAAGGPPSAPRTLSDQQLATVLGENDTKSSFYEQEAANAEKQDERILSAEIGAGLRAALYADHLRHEGTKNDEAGGGPAFFANWLLPNSSVTLGLSLAALEYESAQLRTVTLGAHIGLRRAPLNWLAWGASVGAGLRKLEPIENENQRHTAERDSEFSSSKDGSANGSRKDYETRLPEWDPDQDWAVIEGSIFIRVPSSSLFGCSISLHVPRMIHPEQLTTVEAFLGLTLIL